MNTPNKIIIVGAGISGSVLAREYANLGYPVVIIEKRDHIAGNCYDYYNEDGILVSKYGAHLFHTNDVDVWSYVQRYASWYSYEHRVLAKVDNKLVPVPVNITTVNKIFDLQIKTEKKMRAWLQENQVHFDNPKNGEEAALSRVGKQLYEKMFKNYTKKQWDRYPDQLDASVLNRIPIRSTFDDRYFDDTYQFLPEGGYTKFFENILNHPLIEVKLNTDYFDIKDEIDTYDKLFYTGPIDRFFDFKHRLERELEYRSIQFVFETHDKEYFQEAAVVNYPSPEDGNFTRIVEYKHFTKQKAKKTTISKEFSIDHTQGVTEPYYPVPNPENQAIFDKYKKEADTLQNIYFVGRLANYKYFNMDQAFKNALDLFDELEPRMRKSI